jgi:hypothetical protein
MAAKKSPRGKLSPEDYPRLRKRWMEEYAGVVSEIPLKMPPLRDINNENHLIDESKRTNYRMPKCPDALKDQFNTKLQHYMDAGWWIPATVREATPILCISKKNGKLHTIVDC